jgi:hypothetical protein
VLGVIYVHPYDLDVSLAPDPSTSPPIQSQHGDTTYYFFPTQDLPLFAPLLTLGVPEQHIDVVEPFFRVIVELDDRSIQPWEPTPARLIPRHDPATVRADLVNAIDEVITNAAALIGAPAPLSSPAPAVTTAVGSALPKRSAVTHDDLVVPRRTIAREPARTGDRLNAAIGTVKSVIGDGRRMRTERGKPVGALMLQGLRPCRLELVNHGAGVRDPHGRRVVQRRAVRVQWRPVHHGVAGSAVPTGVAAGAVAEAGDMSDEDLVRA